MGGDHLGGSVRHGRRPTQEDQGRQPEQAGAAVGPGQVPDRRPVHEGFRGRLRHPQQGAPDDHLRGGAPHRGRADLGLSRVPAGPGAHHAAAQLRRELPRGRAVGALARLGDRQRPGAWHEGRGDRAPAVQLRGQGGPVGAGAPRQGRGARHGARPAVDRRRAHRRGVPGHLHQCAAAGAGRRHDRHRHGRQDAARVRLRDRQRPPVRGRREAGAQGRLDAGRHALPDGVPGVLRDPRRGDAGICRGGRGRPGRDGAGAGRGDRAARAHRRHDHRRGQARPLPPGGGAHLPRHGGQGVRRADLALRHHPGAADRRRGRGGRHAAQPPVQPPRVPGSLQVRVPAQARRPGKIGLLPARDPQRGAAGQPHHRGSEGVRAPLRARDAVDLRHEPARVHLRAPPPVRGHEEDVQRGDRRAAERDRLDGRHRAAGQGLPGIVAPVAHPLPARRAFEVQRGRLCVRATPRSARRS